MPRPAAKPAAVPSPPAWQTAATVLLILHLFAVATAIAVNAGGGKSFFGQSLSRIPLVRPYLGLLTMDLAYDFELSGIGPEQGVHELRLLTSPPDDSTGTRGEVFAAMPDEDVWPRIRRQRYQQLAYNLAYFDGVFADNPDLRTQVPVAIAERWLRELDMPRDPYVLECVRTPAVRLPQALKTAVVPLKEAAKKKVDDGPPPPITVFLIWDEDESRYLGARKQPAGEASPVITPPSQEQPSTVAGDDRAKGGSPNDAADSPHPPLPQLPAAEPGADAPEAK